MNLSYKFRLNPTKEQSLLIDNYIFEYNQAYNIGLNLIETRGRTLYDEGVKGNDIFKEMYQTTRSILGNRGIKDKSALTQDAIRNVYNSLFSNIKQNKKFNLHFRNSSSLEGSFVVRNDTGKLNQLNFSFFKHKIKVKLHRSLDDKELGYRIKRENSEYYLIVNLIKETNESEPLILTEDDFLGIDANQGNYTCSNGYTLDFMKQTYPKLEYKRKLHQKRLSKKKKGSKARKKEQKKLFNTSRKIKRKRTHDIHQRVNLILEQDFKINVVEKLNIKNMTKKGSNRGQTKNMLNNSHFQFFALLDYKSRLLNRTLIRINPAYTSRTCSCCGSIQKMSLDQRTYNCPNCNLSLDRDLNASINIKRLGINQVKSVRPVV